MTLITLLSANGGSLTSWVKINFARSNNSSAVVTSLTNPQAYASAALMVRPVKHKSNALALSN